MNSPLESLIGDFLTMKGKANFRVMLSQLEKKYFIRYSASEIKDRREKILALVEKLKNQVKKRNHDLYCDLEIVRLELSPYRIPDEYCLRIKIETLLRAVGSQLFNDNDLMELISLLKYERN